MIRRFEHSQVYAPSTILDSHPGQCGLSPFEDVFFETRDNVKLHAWFFPARGQSQFSDLVLLLLHGNAGNICNRLGFYQAWLDLGLNVLAFDYRGYGRSEGKPGEEGTYLDGEAAHDFLELLDRLSDWVQAADAERGARQCRIELRAMLLRWPSGFQPLLRGFESRIDRRLDLIQPLARRRLVFLGDGA